MEEDIAREIAEECNLKENSVKELVKICLFYNENPKDTIKQFYLSKTCPRC